MEFASVAARNNGVDARVFGVVILLSNMMKRKAMEYYNSKIATQNGTYRGGGEK